MTLNNVIARIRTIGESHKLINSFYFGDVLEYTASDAAKEAAFVATITGGTLLSNQFTLKLALYCFDWCTKDSVEKELNAWSDQLLILQDVIAQLRAASYDWGINETSEVNFFTERYEDSVSGVQTDITITFEYEADRCAVPTT